MKLYKKKTTARNARRKGQSVVKVRRYKLKTRK